MHRSDTSLEAQQVYDRLISRLTGTERFLRGISMTHFCRQLCIAGILERQPSLSQSELKAALFDTIYGDCFHDGEKESIRRVLRKS